MPGPVKKADVVAEAAPSDPAAVKGKGNKAPEVVEIKGKAAAAPAAAAAAAPAAASSTPAPAGGNPAAIVAEYLAGANNNKDNVKRQQAVVDLGRLCTSDQFNSYQPFLVEKALSVLLEKCDDKQAPVRDAAVAAVDALIKAASPYATHDILDVCFSFMNEDAKWRVKQNALFVVRKIAGLHPRQLAVNLSRVITFVNPQLFDIKKEVAEAAEAAITDSFKVVDNRDIEPFIPSLVKAMIHPEDVSETIQELASTTFVQTVESPHLAVIAPLLVRGFREKATALKRQCSVIVANMSKLVDDPAEAAPFLPELLPSLTRAAEEISNPEARGVAEKALAQLLRIKESSQHAVERKAGELGAITKFLKDLVGETVKDESAFKFLVNITSALVNCKHFEEIYWTKFMQPLVAVYAGDNAAAIVKKLRSECNAYATEKPEVEEEAETGEELCNCKFTLAYGTKILLHNATMKLNRGCRYGLLGGNDSGKSTLMRAIANGQVDGFPPATELRTVFVEADIQGEMSHLSCLDYIFADPAIQNCKIERTEIARVLGTVGFSEKMQGDAVTTLSGGWRMKLALARAMLQRADILLLDEPTNHLDVINVKWVENYLNSLKSVTSIIVSHDRGLLDNCCTHILQIENLKLNMTRGNLSEFVKKVPSAMSFFDLKATKFAFKLPKPGYLDGVKSKGKALMKMENCTFTYPTNTKPTISNFTVQVSLSSRVACVGPNGAGKSTMIKILTGELEPQTGTVWKHNGVRVAYVAQHAFHHIEKHLTKTPVQYIQWRYENGEDKEGLEKVTMKMTPEEEAKLKTPIMIDVTDDKGNIKKEKRVVARLTGARKTAKKGFEYEVMWEGSHGTMYMPGEKLELIGFAKILKGVDSKVEAREGAYARALTQENIEQHVEDVGLGREFSSHYRISALSGGQKVKVVLAAAMWNQPHIIILDEPTNYLDRDSLGALSNAIREYEGGVVMITHNNEFCSALCPETWVVENGKLDCQGDPEWMRNAVKDKVEFTMVEEMVDASGNTVKVKQPKKKLSRKEKMARDKHRKMMRDLGEAVSESEEDDE